MLYALQDMTSRALAPWAALAALGSQVAANPLNPFASTGLGRASQAGLELLTRLTKTYNKPRFNIGEVSVGGQSVSVDETVELDKPFGSLVHFPKRTENRGAPLLIVAPLSGHHATLLRGTVQTLLERHDVYITDWRDAREVPADLGDFDLSDYATYVQEFIRFIGQDVHVLAVCQPCVPVLAAVSLMEQNYEAVVPKSLTLIAGPVDTRKSPTAVNKFADDHDMDFFKYQLIEKVPASFAGRGRKVYPGFKQLTGFVMMNGEKHAQAYRDYYDAVAEGDVEKAAQHRKFYDEYNAVLDMPAEYYLETIEKVFKSKDLAEGRLQLCGKLVDPRCIRRIALLTIEGSKDDITGAGQTHVSQELCASLPRGKRKMLTVEGVGHFGAFSGSTFRSTIAPVIGDFIDKHA